MHCTKFSYQIKVVTNQYSQLLCYVIFFDILHHYGVIAASQICSLSRKYCAVLRNRFCSDATVRKCVIERQDKRINCLFSRDIVAAEGHYHQPCYSVFTMKSIFMSGGAINEADQKYETEYQKEERAVCNRLLAFVMNNLFAEPKVITLMDLRDKLLQHMAGEGMTDVQASTTKHIKRKLENKFGDALHIFPDEGGQDNLVLLDNLNIYDLARKNQELTNELQILKKKKKKKKT